MFRVTKVCDLVKFYERDENLCFFLKKQSS